MKAYAHIYNAALVILGLLLLPGCTVVSQWWDRDSETQLQRSNVTIISEDDFAREIARHSHREAALNARQKAVEVVSLLNEPDVQGIVVQAEQANTTPDVIIVARDPGLTGEEIVSAANLYVVPGFKLSPTSKGFRYGRLARIDQPSTEGEPKDKIACSPLPGLNGEPLIVSDPTTDLPADIRLNSESMVTSVNGAKQPVELRIYSGGTANVAVNRYICAYRRLQPVMRERTEASERERWALPHDLLLIKEEQYLPLAKSKKSPALTNRDVQELTEIVAIANHPDRRALEGNLLRPNDEAPAVSRKFIAVAREVEVFGDRVRTQGFYLAPYLDGLPASAILGRNLSLTFGEGRLPKSDSFLRERVRCGPVITPHRPGCFELCEGMANWRPQQAGYGWDRVSRGLERTTVQWPVFTQEKFFNTFVMSCSLFEPPRMRVSLNVCRDTEECNGIDDNCNGEIDEGSVCDVKMQCPCQPRTCGNLTCGTIPDGCGGVLTCGRTCP